MPDRLNQVIDLYGQGIGCSLLNHVPIDTLGIKV